MYWCCENCNNYWQTDDEQYPTCHCDTSFRPCEENRESNDEEDQYNEIGISLELTSIILQIELVFHERRKK